MSFTREDVLRELELLPVWRLRAPVESASIQKVEVTETIATANVETLSVEHPPAIRENIAPILFEITLSHDKKWAFICKPADRIDATSQGMLLSNILQALHIDKPIKSQVQNLTEIGAQVIMAMGEATAQALLNSQDSIENLRGKLHTVADSTVVATYDLAHLLANPLDKANTWQDLCLASAHIASAHIQSLQSKE